MGITFHWMHRNNWKNTKEGLVEMAQTLEDAQVRSVLLPYGPTGVDFTLNLPDIFRSTKKIRMMLALPAYGLTPEYAHKLFYSNRHFGFSRLDLNLVAGKYDQDKQDYVVKHYPGDTSILDTHDKRVALTEPWMEKFYHLMKQYDFTTRLCVVGSSDTTIRVANEYCDYIIIGDYMLVDDFMSRLKNTKPILLIDPLILEDGEKIEDVQYQDYEYLIKQKHNIIGTHEQVVARLKEISQNHGVFDFMVLTDQKDLTRIFRVIKELK